MRAGFSAGEPDDLPHVSKGVWYACALALALSLVFALSGVWLLHKTPWGDSAFDAHQKGGRAVLLFDVIFLSTPCLLGWETFKQARTTWNEQGITQPKLTGSAFIRWEHVERVKARGLAIRIIGDGEKIVINPFFYEEQRTLLSAIAKLVPADALRSSINSQ